MKNKEIIRKVNEGFMKGDVEAILSYVADDVRWDMPGYFSLTGKEAFSKEAINENFEPPVITTLNEIEEGDLVAVEGTVKSRRKDGGILEGEFFDIYRMQDGKIKEMRSYFIMKK